VVKARRRRLPGIYVLLTLVAIAVALGFYGNKVVVQPSETTTPIATTTPLPTETESQLTTTTSPSNVSVSATPTTNTSTTNQTSSQP
jgi:cytoskeletal protein RodZ